MIEAERSAAMDWRCLVCREDRHITVTLPRHDEIDGAPEYVVKPACPGIVSYHQEGGFVDLEDFADRVSEDYWTGRPHCPFDGGDDYQTGDEDAVLALLRERRAAHAAGRAEVETALRQIEAELSMAMQFFHEAATDPEAWVEGALAKVSALLPEAPAQEGEDG